MINIQRILCPTDFSSESDEALRYAVALAHAYEANLLLLHCSEIKSSHRVSEGRHLSVQAACNFERALNNHLGLAELSRLKWEALTIDNVQDIGRAIAHQAKQHGADLIVMRSRRRPHTAMLLGSIAETVSRTAPCPVLVTHAGEREWVGMSAGEIDLHRVLVAHDFSSDAELALSFGVSLAQEYQAELHLLHVLPRAAQAESEFALTKVGESSFTNATRKLKSLSPKESALWCRVVIAIQCGKPYKEVLAYADEHKIDLICMGASGTDFSAWGRSSVQTSIVSCVKPAAQCWWPVL